MVTKAVLEQFFAGGPSRGIDFGRELLWGYFFTHHDRAVLERARPALEARGYRYVGVSDRGGGPVLFLHVERVETHTAESLFQRYQELGAFAAEHQLASFDGFDVGNVDGTGFKRPTA